MVRPRRPNVAGARMTLAGSGALVLVSVPFALLLSTGNLNVMGEVLVIGLLGLSLVPLSGYGGQVSLCQYTFLGLGCVVMAKVGGGHSVLGVLAAVGVCAGVGALLAIPALRLRGLYLALATLAFAILMDNLFFTAQSVMGNGGRSPSGAPSILGVDFTSTRSFVVLLACVFALAAVGVGALRRSRYGRRLVGMDDSPAACTTVGLSLTRTKLAVFTLSAGMAGLAGALYGGLQGTVDANEFAFLLSLAFFLTVTIAGISTLSGPLLGGAFLVVVPILASDVSWGAYLVYILSGAGAIAIGRRPTACPSSIWTPRRSGSAAATGASRPRCPPPPSSPPTRSGRPTSGSARLAELEVRDVAVRFGGVQALLDAGLTVPGGRVTGLIGPNGAGKTTLFNVVTGLQAPNRGEVLLDGRDITRAKPHRRARMGIARTFQRLEVVGSLTARENVLMAAEAQRRKLPPTSPHGLADQMLARVGIAEVGDQPADSLSTGLARLVELARALATSPTVLLLDEPSSGLDRHETTALGTVLRSVAADGLAVLLVEHDMGLVMDVCDDITVLDYGEVIARGRPADVQADPAVQAAYLGVPEKAASDAPPGRDGSGGRDAWDGPGRGGRTGRGGRHRRGAGGRRRTGGPGGRCPGRRSAAAAPGGGVGRARGPTGGSRSSTTCPCRWTTAPCSPCSDRTGRGSRAS